MENTEFKELLLNIAVLAIACDGHIDAREIEALHRIEKDSPYFSAIDLSKNLENALQDCAADLEAFQKKIFDILSSNSLNIVQELTALEISLRIIAADEIEEDSEKLFINELRAQLALEDFIINKRFGDIAYLKPKKSEFNKDKPNDLEDINIKSTEE